MSESTESAPLFGSPELRLPDDLRGPLKAHMENLRNRYVEMGWAGRGGFGSKPALIVIDLALWWTKPDKPPMGSHIDPIVESTCVLLKGARAQSVTRNGDRVTVHCDDGRVAEGSHVILAVGSIPNSDRLDLDTVGIETEGGYIPIDRYCRTAVPHIYAAGDVSGKLPLSSVAQMQGRKIAEHAMGLTEDRPHRQLDYDKAASAVFTEPEIADVGLAEADAFAEGRKIRVTKVPFSASAKAVINDDPRGFIKIVSDPATGVVLGGSIVGRHAAELIAIVALAVTAGLTVHDIQESLFVHPTLAEALAEAAE